MVIAGVDPASGPPTTRMAAGPFPGVYLSEISRPLHCYGSRQFVPLNSRVAAGRSIRVLVIDKQAGRVADTRVVVRRFSRSLVYGRAIGCGADPKTHAWTQ